MISVPFLTRKNFIKTNLETLTEMHIAVCATVALALAALTFVALNRRLPPWALMSPSDKARLAIQLVLLFTLYMALVYFGSSALSSSGSMSGGGKGASLTETSGISSEQIINMVGKSELDVAAAAPF